MLNEMADLFLKNQMQSTWDEMKIMVRYENTNNYSLKQQQKSNSAEFFHHFKLKRTKIPPKPK